MAWSLHRLGAPLTWRQGALALAAGSTFSIVLTILLGIFLALVIFSVGLARYAMPSMLVFLVIVALQAPIPEEFSKALGGIFFGRKRITNERQAFAIGLLCGAGFAILENMLYQGIYAARSGWTWGGVTLLRAFGSVLHPLATAIVVLGWYRMKERGGTSLLQAYAAAVGLHTLWNGGFIAFLYTLGLDPHAPRATVDVYGMPVQIALVGYLILLSLGLWLLLIRLVRGLAPGSAPESVEVFVSRRALAGFAVACVIAIVPIGLALGRWWR